MRCAFLYIAFALDKWKEDNNMTAIDEYQTVKLLEELAIAPFMLTNQCDIRDDFVIGKLKINC
jgi:hypothetical protein